MVPVTGAGPDGRRVPLLLLAHDSRLLPSRGIRSKCRNATMGLHFLPCREAH